MLARVGGILLGAAIAGLAPACFYNPTIGEAQFFCHDGVCPDGLSCTGAPDYVCVADPASYQPDQGADRPGDRGGDAPDAPPADMTAVDRPPTDGPSQCSPDEFEPNDSQVAAVGLGPGSNLPLGFAADRGRLCPGDEDWYKITLSSVGLLVRLNSSDDLSGVKLELLDSLGNHITDGMPKGSSLVVLDATLVADTYFVRVHGSAPAAGVTYGLDVASPPNDRCEGAIEMVAGGPDFTADFSAAKHDYDPGPQPMCTKRSEAGLDLAYEFSLTSLNRVVIEADTFANDFAMMLLKGNDPSACTMAGTSCIAGAVAVNPPARGDDAFLDLMLTPGHYYLVLSDNEPEATRAPINIHYTLAAECVTRPDCNDAVAKFCDANFKCIDPPSGLVEVNQGMPFTPVDVPDAPAQGMVGTVQVPLMVSQFGGNQRVASVKVGVVIKHTFRSDLVVTLISPPDPQHGNMSRRVILFNGPAMQDPKNDVHELYDVTAPSVDSLAQLGDSTNAPADGLWQLEVSDTVPLDQGRVIDFRLYIQTR